MHAHATPPHPTPRHATTQTDPPHPPTTKRNETQAAPQPPEDSKFVFIGVGVSVYNKEMLGSKRMPLVNGLSQLVISKPEQELDETAAAAAANRHEADGANRNGGGGGDAPSGRRHGHRHRQPPPATQAGETPGVGVGAAAAGRAGQQGSAVPATMSQQRRGGAAGAAGGIGREEDGGGPSNRDQMEALAAYAVGRVRKQVEITKQVAEELTKLTPGKLREAAVVQANKVQEMPTLLLNTSKRMVGSGTKFVRKYLDEQERKK